MAAIFNNRTIQVIQSFEQKSAKAARAMAEDVVKVSNPKTPHSGTGGGGLRSKRRIEQKNTSSYNVHWSVPYASAINRGFAGRNPVKRWTTPGTGKGFVELGLKHVRKNAKGYFK